jgi:predicted enzyme related to lactoylglutathione lyase
MRPNPVIDSQDPERIAPFWSGLLDLQVTARHGGGEHVVVGSLSDGFLLVIHRVPEPKVGKNRVHLDVHVEDLDEGTARVEALGGSWTEPGNTRELDGSFLWRCMSDPEGNEFCIHQLPHAATNRT